MVQAQWEVQFLCSEMIDEGTTSIVCSYLTLKWPRYFYSGWYPIGSSMEPPEKTIFPPEFCIEIYTIYVRAIKNHNSANKKNKIK